MIFGGFQPLTLLDYPGRVACIAFTQGCNLRCGYCHNPQLIDTRPAENTTPPKERDIFEFLKKRCSTIDGIVVSGGEPTIQHNLVDFLIQVKLLGLLVKLDTNGTNPQVLREALDRGLLDYVAMDVKHDPARYVEITDVAVDPRALAASRDLLLSSGIAHEFRTTVVPQIHDEAVVEQIALFCRGASRLVLQSVVATNAWKPTFQECRSPNSDDLRRLKHIAEQYAGGVELSCRDK